MSNYFFRKDSSKYSIIAGGDSIEKCFVTFRERKSGIMLINFRADEFLKDDASLAEFIEYLDVASQLEGEELEAHLEGFLPLSQLNATNFSTLIFPSQTEKQLSGVSIARLMTTSSITEWEEYLNIMNRLYNSLSDFSMKAEDPLEALLMETETKEVREDIKNLIDSGGVENIETFVSMRSIKAKLTSGTLGGVITSLDGASREGRICSSALSAIHYKLHMRLGEDLGNNNNLARILSAKSSSHHLPLKEGYEDYNDALKDLVMGNSDIMTLRDLDETGLFGGSYGNQFKKTLYGSRFMKNGPTRGREREKRAVPYPENNLRGTQASILQYISRIDDPKEKRNAIQILKSIGFGIGVATRYDDFIECARANVRNQGSLSKSLWEYINRNVGMDTSIQEGRDKFGKKETKVLLSNIEAMNDIVLRGESSTIRTFEGESIEITPLSRGEMVSYFTDQNRSELDIDPLAIVDGKDISSGYNANIAKYARVSLTGKNGEEIFKGYTDIFNMSDTFPSIFAISDMPSNTLSEVGHLKAIIEAFNNPSLVKSLCVGGLKLRNGEIKDRNLYSGPWQSITNIINDAISRNPAVAGGGFATTSEIERKGILLDYTSMMKTHDAAKMLSQALTAMKSKYMPEALPHNYSNDNFDLCSEIGEVTSIMSLGIQHDFNQDDVASVMSFMNYNSALKIAEKAHSNYGQMKKITAPNARIHWEKSLPDTTLWDTKGRKIEVSNINSHSGVIQEGVDMEHCISSYSSMCAKGEYMAFTIYVDGDKCATLGMTVGENYLTYDQLQGPKNTPVDHVIESTLQEQFIRPLVRDMMVQGHQVVFSGIGTLTQEYSGEEALSIILDYEIEDDCKFAILKDYVVSILGRDAVFDMISTEIDDLERSIKDELGGGKRLPEALGKIADTRNKLCSDFSRNKGLDI